MLNSTLHLIYHFDTNTKPFLEANYRLGDAVILIQDGVLGLFNDELIDWLKRQEKPIYVLQEDLACFGLSQTQYCRTINLETMVEMIFQYSHTLTWQS